MDTKDIVRLLAAIAHETRLQAYRYLVEAGPAGLHAGRLAELLEIPPSSLTFHLKELVHAGLLSSRQEGRFVSYSVEYAAMNSLLIYLTENCCGGNPCSPVSVEVCSPADQNRR
ncbi:helix-turn-helix transcriptional regulator [Alcaligenaceae bacterium]|nr:helix-turn-helix transcriptional regulator [Alcaligenaceae bacterium]